jgi:hypothetical protein
MLGAETCGCKSVPPFPKLRQRVWGSVESTVYQGSCPARYGRVRAEQAPLLHDCYSEAVNLT